MANNNLRQFRIYCFKNDSKLRIDKVAKQDLEYSAAVCLYRFLQPSACLAYWQTPKQLSTIEYDQINTSISL